MNTLWRLHNLALDLFEDFANSPIDHKEDTLLGIVCFIGLLGLLYRAVEL